MNKILSKQIIATNTKRVEIASEVIARRAKAGQFVMVMPDAKSEKIPLAIVDADSKRGTIILIFEEAGETTKKLGALSIGSEIFSILGPLGMPAQMPTVSVVLCVGYGIYISQMLSMCKAYRKTGCKVVGLIGAKTKNSLILEARMRMACNKLYVVTDDGTYERKGFVSAVLPEIIKKESVNLLCAAAPVSMLEEISKITKERELKTLIQLNPTMVDGIGLCGSCRVKVEGESILACVDGPQFDAHKVDFSELTARAQL